MGVLIGSFVVPVVAKNDIKKLRNAIWLSFLLAGIGYVIIAYAGWNDTFMAGILRAGCFTHISAAGSLGGEQRTAPDLRLTDQFAGGEYHPSMAGLVHSDPGSQLCSSGLRCKRAVRR
ncbi:MAG: hypothetical protein U0670_17030 [Anaerolineae bacterium]